MILLTTSKAASSVEWHRENHIDFYRTNHSQESDYISLSIYIFQIFLKNVGSKEIGL